MLQGLGELWVSAFGRGRVVVRPCKSQHPLPGVPALPHTAPGCWQLHVGVGSWCLGFCSLSTLLAQDDMAPQLEDCQCLCTVRTVPPPTATNPCQSGCDYCSFGHNGAWRAHPVSGALHESSTASSHTCCRFATGLPPAVPEAEPRLRAPMQASAAPTRRPVPYTYTTSPSPATLRLSCGAWKWSRPARPAPILTEAVMVVAMLLLGPMIGRGGCDVPPAQTKALMELYSATNGSSWAQSQGWIVGGDPCTGGWYGVTCSPDLGAVEYVTAATHKLHYAALL